MAMPPNAGQTSPAAQGISFYASDGWWYADTPADLPATTYPAFCKVMSDHCRYMLTEGGQWVLDGKWVGDEPSGYKNERDAAILAVNGNDSGGGGSGGTTPGGGVTVFDELTGRPKFGGVEMTSATDIPPPVTSFNDLTDRPSYGGSQLNGATDIPVVAPFDYQSAITFAPVTTSSPPAWDTPYSLSYWLQQLTAYEYELQKRVTQTYIHDGTTPYVMLDIPDTAIIEVFFDYYDSTVNHYARFQILGENCIRDLIPGGSSFPYGTPYLFKGRMWLPTGGAAVYVICPADLEVSGANSPQGTQPAPIPLPFSGGSLTPDGEPPSSLQSGDTISGLSLIDYPFYNVTLPADAVTLCTTVAWALNLKLATQKHMDPNEESASMRLGGIAIVDYSGDCAWLWRFDSGWQNSFNFMYADLDEEMWVSWDKDTKKLTLTPSTQLISVSPHAGLADGVIGVIGVI